MQQQSCEMHVLSTNYFSRLDLIRVIPESIPIVQTNLNYFYFSHHIYIETCIKITWMTMNLKYRGYKIYIKGFKIKHCFLKIGSVHYFKVRNISSYTICAFIFLLWEKLLKSVCKSQLIHCIWKNANFIYPPTFLILQL